MNETYSKGWIYKKGINILSTTQPLREHSPKDIPKDIPNRCPKRGINQSAQHADARKQNQTKSKGNSMDESDIATA